MNRHATSDPNEEHGTKTFRWLDPAEADADNVLRRLLHEAAEVVPGLSGDPALTDPLVRLLLAATSREYARLYGKLDDVVDMAYRRLVESLLSFPRAPRPSATVLHLAVTDPGVRVDENLQVVGRKAIAGPGGSEETNIRFSPLAEQTVDGVPSPVVILAEATGRVRLLAAGGELPGAPAIAGATWDVDTTDADVLWLGFDLPADHDFEEISVFAAGSEAATGGLMWSTWEAGSGSIVRDFVPGRLSSLHPWHRSAEPGVFRSRTDMAPPSSDYDRFFVPLSREFLLAGQGVQAPAVERGIAAGHLPSVPTRCWVQVRPAEGVTGEQLATVRLLTNCVVAFNVNRESASFSVGTEPVQVVEMPTTFRELFRIFEIHDSTNKSTYADAESSGGLGATHRYHLDTSPSGKAQLRLSAAQPAIRPRKVEVQYATTYGHEANALDRGSIDVIYDQRLTPGVDKAVNVVPSSGGGAPGAETQHAEELRAILASRGRALTRHDYAQLTRAFDPERIADVSVERGVIGDDRGVSTCVQVRTKVRAARFVSPLERESFRGSLNDYLQTRAAAGQSVVVLLED